MLFPRVTADTTWCFFIILALKYPLAIILLSIESAAYLQNKFNKPQNLEDAQQIISNYAIYFWVLFRCQQTKCSMQRCPQVGRVVEKSGRLSQVTNA